MANVRQDRVPDPTLSHASAPASEGTAVNGRAAAPRTIVLSLRLRTQDSSGYPADMPWTGNAPAAALAIDVLSASGVAFDPPQGAVLPGRFSSFQSALLAVRRLQWALQGLAESAQSPGIAASIAVHSDAAAGAAIPFLEKLAPGQVVVDGSLVEAVQTLPGAVLRETADGRWRELLWRSAETSSGFSSDEQSLLGILRALGREDPCPPAAEAPRPPTATSAAAPITGGFYVPESLGRSSLEPEPATGIGKFKWLIVAGVAVVVVLVAILVIPGIVSGSHGKAPAQSPDTSTKSVAPPAQVPAPAVASTPAPVVEKPQNTKQPAKSAKQPKAESKPETPPQKPPAVTGPCPLTEAEIPRSLNRAEQAMYAGKLEEAQAMYQRVLPCPSAHDKAQEGLQRVRQRIAAQQ